jgi:putative membrane protein
MKQFLIQAVGHALFAAALFSTTSTALAQSAQDFVNKVAISDMLEIQSSQLALSKQAAKDGKDFDRTYDQIQLKAHQDAVALFEAYSKNGDNPELKSWAAATLPHLKEHLSMAEKLK